MSEEQNQDPRAEIDLNRYLNKLAESRGVAAAPGTGQAEPPPTQPQPGDAGASQCDFEALAARRAWRELIETCEHAMHSDSGDSSVARLWWVHAQLQIGAMPPSILAAPLESATAAIASRAAEFAAAHPKLIRLAEETLLDVAERLKASGDELALPLLERAYRLNGRNGAQLLEAVDKEADGIAKRRRKRPGEADKLERLEDLRSELTHEQPAPQPQPQRRVRASRRVLVLSLSIAIALVLSVDRFRTVLLPGLAKSGSSSAIALDITRYPAEPRPAPLLPELSRAAAPSSNTLGGILRALDGGAAKEEAAEAPAPAAPSDAHVQRVRETVNTSGPVEPEKVKHLLEGVDWQQDKARNEPLFDERRGPVVPAYPVPPTPVRMFAVLKTTEVLAAPHREAQVVGKLYGGDRALVSDFEQGWAKIISQAGRPGYIDASTLGRAMN